MNERPRLHQYARPSKRQDPPHSLEILKSLIVIIGLLVPNEPRIHVVPLDPPFDHHEPFPYHHVQAHPIIVL